MKYLENLRVYEILPDMKSLNFREYMSDYTHDYTHILKYIHPKLW